MFGPHKITRLRAAPVIDPYSGEVTGLEWSDPDRLPIEGCSVQPGPAQRQDLDRRSSVTILFTVWAPTSDVTEQDRVEYAGETYAIDETIQVWDFPPLAHAVIPLRRVEG